MKNSFGETIPEKLYKYMPWPVNDVNYARAVIINRKVHLQKPAKFNDPFDCKIYVQGPNDDPDANEYASGFMNSLHREDTWITCLTKNFDNILMWSHYAADHTGICVEFQMLTNNILKVDYKENYPVFDLSVYNVDAIDDMPKEKLIEMGKMFFARKSTLWEYEQEYRYVTSNTSNIVEEENYVPLQGFANITSIICGCEMKAETVLEIKQLLKGQNLDVPVKQLKVKEKEYGLEEK